MMKLKLGLSIMCLITTCAFSQTIKSAVEIKEYLLKNISSLDPIEGIWGVDNITWTTFYKKKPVNYMESTQNKKIAIIKSGDKCLIYQEEETNYSLSDAYYEIKGLPGHYYCYQLFFQIAHTSNATMTDLFTLEHEVQLDYLANRKNRMLLDFASDVNERTTDNFDVIVSHKYSKTFPTFNDYQNAKKSEPIQGKSSGSGFAISSNGYIVTNYHVIEGAGKVSVRGINGDFSKAFNAKVVLTDKNNDIAIIQIDDASFVSIGAIPYSIKTTILDVGEEINVLGYPLTATMGEEIKFTNGIISSKSGFQGDITSYQCSAPIQPGNSGGPMFDKSGMIVGIINAKHTNTDNVSYAIKSTYILNLIQSLPNPPKTDAGTLIGKSLIDQIKIISKYVYIIEK